MIKNFQNMSYDDAKQTVSWKDVANPVKNLND